MSLALCRKKTKEGRKTSFELDSVSNVCTVQVADCRVGRVHVANHAAAWLAWPANRYSAYFTNTAKDEDAIGILALTRTRNGQFTQRLLNDVSLLSILFVVG